MNELCLNETKKKCDSFYKEAFLNRKEYINQLEKELSKYKEKNKMAINILKEIKAKYINGSDVIILGINEFDDLLEILEMEDE